MRHWIFLLMLIFAASLTPYTRSTLRSFSSRVSLLRPSNTRTLVAGVKPTIRALQTPKAQAMAEAIGVNPMPILSQASKPDPAVVVEELPTLSASDFRVYNRLAVMMDAYHTRFRQTWNMLYSVAEQGQRPAGLSIRNFIQTGLQFCHHLHVHHTIEERYIFPELAERMESFKDDEELIHQHEQIAAGLDKLQTYLQECQMGSHEMRLSEVKAILDSFGTVLWTHLDEEVKTLGAENMRKYWSKEEIAAMEW